MPGIAIGLTITGDILMGGPLTGAAMNPARWLGTAVVSSTYTDGWLYIVGPILGGLVAAAVWEYVIKPSPAEA